MTKPIAFILEIAGIPSLILAILEAFFKDIKWEIKLIWVLAGLVFALVLVIIQLLIIGIKREKILDDRISKHKALAKQFEKKSKCVFIYRDYWNYIYSLLRLALLQNNKDQVSFICREMLDLTNKIRIEEDSNG